MPTLADPRAARAQRAVHALRTDFERWALRCYHIRDKRGVVRPLALRPNQRAIDAAEALELRRTGKARLFVLKARQGGVSTHQQARALHQIWSQPHFDALTLADSADNTEKIFGITRRAIEHFPAALQPALGEKGTKEVSYPGLDSLFFTGTAGSKRTGRGITLKRFHGSEFAMWDDPDSALGAVTPALVPSGSTIVLETTASGVGSPGHTFWLEAEQRGYVRLFYPWWECDPEGYRLPLLEPDELGELEDDEQALVARHGLDLEQIKWRRETMRELTRAIFLQEYAEDADSCWLAVGGMFYDADLLRLLIQRQPVPTETLMGGELALYAEPLPRERVIIGSDTAEGTGGDRTTWTARSFPSWTLLARFASRTITPSGPDGLGRLLDTWGRRYGTALLVIEKNAHGITTLRELRDVLHYPLTALYHRAPLDNNENQLTERIGWATTGESKPLLLDAGRELFAAARDGLAGVPSAEALADALTVRRDKTGKVDLNGRDVLVSEMLCWIGRSAPTNTGFLDYYRSQSAALTARQQELAHARP